MDLAQMWARFLMREGIVCTIAGSEAQAFSALRQTNYAAIILDIELETGNALAVADFATYRDPDVPIITVTAARFFSGGEVFDLVPNARGMLPSPPRLDDLAAITAHYGSRQHPPADARKATG